ncbi:AhpD family alkylhydroperoxidase [Paenibacillus sp. V4I9]|uniref:carboxymuconolactone decarboxylase family protein n=1 Tax=Paenibacillus sp. V4I9 TaxID=3042308 RepID=UPI00277ECD6A|nr:carboxymuconolactone decarboxylase family protein [Paenibacillus sp. V4I9]MDQ0889797.1 AhpD family alkylhydroperoxidase [Paenibacillus sp. V4I9]
MSEESLYQSSYLKRLSEMHKLAPEGMKAFSEFSKKATAPGLLSEKTKELIAVASAHITGCAYCIESHTTKAKIVGASKEEIAEAVLVAVALKAGSALAHSVNALNAYDKH